MINPATDGVFVNNNVQPQRIPDIFEPFGLAVGSFKFFTQNCLLCGNFGCVYYKWRRWRKSVGDSRKIYAKKIFIHKFY